MSDEAEATGGPPTPKFSIRTRLASVDAEGVELAEAYAIWERAARLQATLDQASTRIEGGSVAGFQFDPSDEHLNDKLPGGWLH